MGEFLSTPIKEKVSEDNEDQFVKIKTIIIHYLNLIRLDMVHVECKVGEKGWKILIFLTWEKDLKAIFMFLVFLMVTEVIIENMS